VLAPDNRKSVPGGQTTRLVLASSNPGKLREYRAMASDHALQIAVELELLAGFSELPDFAESAPTFAENAVGKALHYSQFTELPVVADDSGLVVDALGGEPGVRSARYAGPAATDAQRIEKLLSNLRAVGATEGAQPRRTARFVCIITLARKGRVKAVFSDSVSGEILDAPRGAGGFGYDPVFLLAGSDKTFAEISGREKNLHSHRGKAFRKLLQFLETSPVL
jgi:XTP/dITP diphosphohydrolase